MILDKFFRYEDHIVVDKMTVTSWDWDEHGNYSQTGYVSEKHEERYLVLLNFIKIKVKTTKCFKRKSPISQS